MTVLGARRGVIFEDSQQPNSDVVAEWSRLTTMVTCTKLRTGRVRQFRDGKLYNINATLENFTTTGGVKKMARYRWNWRKRAVSSSANDFTNLFRLVDAVNNPDTAAYTSQTEAEMDVEEWMRVFCVEHIAGNWDSYGYSRGKNMYGYRPQNGKWQLFAGTSTSCSAREAMGLRPTCSPR